MVDSSRLLFRVDETTLQEIRTTFRGARVFVTKEGYEWALCMNVKGLRMTYVNKYNLLFIRFNVDKLLGKAITADYEFAMLEYKIDEVLSIYFSKLRVKSLELSRIDYKCDIKLNYREHYYDIFSKMSTEYRKKKKGDYLTSLYFNGTTYSINVYDKYVERKGEKKFKDIFRLEIQLKRGYLKNYLKKYGVMPIIANYYTNDMRHDFFEMILKPLFMEGDHYTLSESKRILSSFYSENMVDKLIKFQEDIYNHEMSGIKDIYCKNTRYRYIKKLAKANINPISISNSTGINFLPNLYNIYLASVKKK